MNALRPNMKETVSVPNALVRKKVQVEMYPELVIHLCQSNQNLLYLETFCFVIINDFIICLTTST